MWKLGQEFYEVALGHLKYHHIGSLLLLPLALFQPSVTMGWKLGSSFLIRAYRKIHSQTLEVIVSVVVPYDNYIPEEKPSWNLKCS